MSQGRAQFEFKQRLVEAIEYDEEGMRISRTDKELVVVLTTGERVLVTFSFSGKPA